MEITHIDANGAAARIPQCRWLHLTQIVVAPSLPEEGHTKAVREDRHA